MRKIKMLIVAMALALAAMQANDGAASTTCEETCYKEYAECQVFCSKNPCFVPCEIPLRICLDNCGSES